MKASHLTTCIPISDIHSLTHINGLSIEHIERRARAISDNLTDPLECRYRSFDGFLADEQHLVDVIASDHQLITNDLHTTSNHLASLLRQAMQQVDQVVSSHHARE
jgi:hypothetical protein